MACWVAQAGQRLPTHAVAEVPGGQLRGTMTDFVPAEQLADLGQSRLVRGGAHRPNLVLDGRPRRRVAVVQADGLDLHLAHRFRRDIHHSGACRPVGGRRAADRAAERSPPERRCCPAACSHRNCADLGQHRHAGEGLRQLDRQRLVGLVADQQPALRSVAGDQLNFELLLLEAGKEFHFSARAREASRSFCWRSAAGAGAHRANPAAKANSRRASHLRRERSMRVPPLVPWRKTPWPGCPRRQPRSANPFSVVVGAHPTRIQSSRKSGKSQAGKK